MKMKKLYFESVLGAILLIATLIVPAFAGSSRAEISAQRTAGGFEIAGSGFAKFETVRIVLESQTADIKTSVRIADWSVIADSDGGFVTNVSESFLASGRTGLIVRATGMKSTAWQELVLAADANLDQCANGPFSTPVQCTGSNWQNGNIGSSNGHYYEGDSVPYRLRFSDLTVGASNTVTIEWDTTQSGTHALDYLTSYNRTESIGNNPCSGVVPACGSSTTFPIPMDPNVSGQGVTQIPGQVFTMWGGTITGVSAYTLSGTYAGNSSTAITITFTPSQANPVLAWGGHIAEQADWALLGGSANNIPGSPYHTRLIDLNGSGGNQDRSLSTAGVRLNSQITIIKQATPETALAFGFTATNLSLGSFNLVDDGVDNDATPNNISFSGLLAPATSGTYTVTENAGTGFYSLSSLVCVGSSGSTSTFTTSVPSRMASINLQYGDTVTCTFTNFVTTAAGLSAGGRVVTTDGSGIARARVSILNVSTGETRIQYTSTFGYFNFEDLPAGDFYVARVEHKRYGFISDTAAFTLGDSVSDIEFIASP